MNVMLVSVSQRVAEVRLLKAVGASKALVARLFLVEALVLASAGALIGTSLGLGLCVLFNWAQDQVEISPPLWALLSAPLAAIGCGALFGVLPARRAASLDPVRALARR